MNAFLEDNPGTPFKEDPKGNGWRRVVASPQPLKVMNVELVESLAKSGNIVITVGGGGIPVVEKEEHQFAEGSMAPKVRAAIYFVKNGGKECIITEAGQLNNPQCGTRIVK